MPANASISYSSSRFADIIGACLMVVSHVAHAAPPPDADMSLAPLVPLADDSKHRLIVLRCC
jgi:predicted cobalt transporter CbtA